MTEKQFKDKTDELLKEVEPYLKKEVLRLFKSGAIDSNDYEDNFLLPKIILGVALANLREEYMFSSKIQNKIVKNLRCF